MTTSANLAVTKGRYGRSAAATRRVRFPARLDQNHENADVRRVDTTDAARLTKCVRTDLGEFKRALPAESMDGKIVDVFRDPDAFDVTHLLNLTKFALQIATIVDAIKNLVVGRVPARQGNSPGRAEWDSAPPQPFTPSRSPSPSRLEFGHPAFNVRFFSLIFSNRLSDNKLKTICMMQHPQLEHCRG